MIDRLSIRGGPTPASCGYVLHPVPRHPPSRTRAIPPFKYTHYTFIRALNTSRIDGIERCTLYVRHICVFPSSSPRSFLCPLPRYSALRRSSLPLFLPPLTSPPAKPTGRLASGAPLHRFCVGRAMLDWCRCVCKRAGQHQCFESSVRPHYFTPGLGTAIPSTSCSLYNPGAARRGITPFSFLSLPRPPTRPTYLPPSRARSLGSHADPDAQPILIDMGFRLPLTTYVT